MASPIIIIGTGLAGYHLARAWRKLDSETPLLMITENDGYFYPKPMLSQAMTMGKDATTIPMADVDDMREQLNGEILTNTSVTAINTNKKTVTAGDVEYAYSKLVLACGADILKPPFKGDGADDIFSVNELRDYRRFTETIHDKKRIAIIGAGLIGCEFSNDLTNSDFDVHVIASEKTPLFNLLPEAVGVLLQHALAENGVTWHLSCLATTVNKEDGGYQVLLSDGSALSVDRVLSATGIRPHVALAKNAGLAVGDGVIVNRQCQTSAPDVFALGDCAEVDGHVLLYVSPLMACTKALAQTLSGSPTDVHYPAMPVQIKTPAHPIVIAPPPKGVEGEWRVSVDGCNARAKFIDEAGNLRGFVLTNDAVKERMALVKELPGLFS